MHWSTSGDQLKYMQRIQMEGNEIFFRTPEMVAKMGPTYLNRCWRNCSTQIDNHAHIFWTCPKLRTFWEEVFEALIEVFYQNLTKDPKVALLGLTPMGIDGRAKKNKCITMKWLKPEPPTYNVDWTGMGNLADATNNVLETPKRNI